jgi:hypothetical protein
MRSKQYIGGNQSPSCFVVAKIIMREYIVKTSAWALAPPDVLVFLSLREYHVLGWHPRKHTISMDPERAAG